MTRRSERSADLPTAAAVGIVAYAAANVVHELAGHCGAAAMLGGGCDYISTTDIRLGPGTPLDLFPVIAAAGTLANFAAAAIAIVLLRRWALAGAGQLFLWLLAAINLFVGAGYLAVSPIVGFGDWHNILVALDAGIVWRAGTAAAGALAWWLSWTLCRRELGRMVGQDVAPRSTARRLLWASYAGGSAVIAAAALSSPLPLPWAMLVGLGSAAGLTAPLLVLPFTLPAAGRAAPFALPRSPAWLAGGLTVAVGATAFYGKGFPV